MRRATQRIAIILTILLISLGGLAYGVYLPLDTEYAVGYTPEGFDRISVGMGEEAVLAILGPPLYRSPEGDGEGSSSQVWVYSRQGRNKRANFFARLLTFESKQVRSIEKYVYFD